MSDRLPYFKFYPGDYLAGAGRAGLSLEAQGAYFVLLCQMWEINRDRAEWIGLPGTEQTYARILGVGVKKWRRLRAELVDGPTPVLVLNASAGFENGRLRSEWQAARKRFEKSRSGGLKSAKTREVAGDLLGSKLEPGEPPSGNLEPTIPEYRVQSTEKEEESRVRTVEADTGRPPTRGGDSPPPPPSPPRFGPDPSFVRQTWNAYLVPLGFEKLDRMPRDRCATLERLARDGVLVSDDDFVRLVKEIADSPYLRGEVEGKRYPSDFDWILDSPKRVRWVLSGGSKKRATSVSGSTKPCEAEGCTRPPNIGGYCLAHYAEVA